MEISLETLQRLSPDQASLNAAKKLLKPSQWPLLGQTSSLNCIWGQCQGSGANPYSAMADVVDHGYKCTCPSRKFPCKHVLALLWQFADSSSNFTEMDAPEWVHDWLGRRRRPDKKSVAEPDVTSKTKQTNNIHLATDSVIDTSEDIAKKQLEKEKRSAQLKLNTDERIQAILIDFQQWINDQLRSGIAIFIKDINERCRQMAARLVDAKAANLASRLDELPAKILPLASEEQANAVLKELGQLVLLSESWFAHSEDIDTRRAIVTTENKEQLLTTEHVLRRSGIWMGVGEKIHTRKDGLVSHASWLMQMENTQPTFALLQDYYPAASGKRNVSFGIGNFIQGELIFYPGRSPMRAFFSQFEIIPSPHTEIPWPKQQQNIFLHYAEQLSLLPWLEECPSLLGQGRIISDNKKYWWRSMVSDMLLPLTNSYINPLLLGCILDSCFVIWDGERAELFSTQTTRWGILTC